MADLGFQAIASDALRQGWPVFVTGAVAQAWLVLRIRRTRRFPVRWIAPAVLGAAGLAAVLWVESFLATQLAYQTLGAGALARPWEELQAHVARSWPLLACLGVVLLGLALHPRKWAVAVLVAAAGVLVSWLVAMWLFVTNHQPLVFRMLVVPGGLGIVASAVGFSASTALWMAIGRWIWRRAPDPM